MHTEHIALETASFLYIERDIYHIYHEILANFKALGFNINIMGNDCMLEMIK